MPECFEIPSKIYIPVLASCRANSLKARKQDHWFDTAGKKHQSSSTKNKI